MNWPADFIDKVICGDCLGILQGLPDESIDMCLTSPPYFGLRDYGVDGQYGLEPTPELYIEHMTAAFHEVKRILRKDGTLWLNIGDTYGGSCQDGGDTGLSKERYRKELLTYVDKPQKKLMPKCLLMIPERLAWSLIQDGWILRNRIVWYKPVGMPSSVKDRFTNTWEYVFLFSRSRKYYFDLDAVREKCQWDDPWGDSTRKLRDAGMISDHDVKSHPAGKNPGDIFFIKDRKKSGRKYENIPGQEPHSIARHSGYYDENGKCLVDFEKGKNPGDFWSIPTQPFPEAHFAVFPEKLCEKPIKAGCPEQVCKKCGKARERITEKQDTGLTQKMPDFWESKPGSHSSIHREGREKGKTGIPVITNKTIGWTDCGCNAGFDGGIVLDPFCGAGTVLLVAKNFKRHYIGIDIKREFCKMSEKRTSQGVL